MTNRPYIIDIEASGFGCSSYPIEIGIALQHDQRYCSLIKPDPSWQYWDPNAESTHHISRATLFDRGKPVHQVAQELNQLLSGKTVYSDGWVVDEPWLITLFATAKIQRDFFIYDLQTILSEAQMHNWHDVKQEVSKQLQLRRHRATNDARVIQETFVRTLQEP